MNINQVLSALRDVAKFVGAGTAGGYVLQNWLHVDLTQMSDALAGVGAIIAFSATAWSQFSGTKAAIVAKAADIVTVPPEQQKRVGIVAPQVKPTSPPKPAAHA